MKKNDFNHIVTFKGHKLCPPNESSVNAIALFPDKKHFVSGGDDCIIKLWSISKMIPIKEWRQETDDSIGRVTSLVVLNENEFLSCGFDLTIKLWNKSRNEPLKTFYNKTLIHSISLFPEKRFFITLYKDPIKGEIKIWDLESNESLSKPIDNGFKLRSRTMSGIIQQAYSIAAISSEQNSGKFLVGGNAGLIEIWKFEEKGYTLENGRNINFEMLCNNRQARGHINREYNVSSLVVMPDNLTQFQFLSANEDENNSVIWWQCDLTNPNPVNIITKLKVFSPPKPTLSRREYFMNYTNRLAIFPDSSHFASTYEGKIRLWRLNQRTDPEYRELNNGDMRRRGYHQYNVSNDLNRENEFERVKKVDGIGEDQELPNESIKTLVVIDNNNILSGWTNRHIRWYSTYDRPIGEVNRNWFDNIFPNENINHMLGYANRQDGDEYIEKMEKPKGGKNKSRRVNKRYIKRINKTRRRK